MKPLPAGWRLERATDAGVRRITRSQVERLCKAGCAVGLYIMRLDLAGCTGKDELLVRLAAAFEFPTWFGHNWDALADCLGDLDWLSGNGYLLVIENTADLQRAAPETLSTALEILADASRDWQARDVPLWVLVTRSRPRR